MDKIKTPFRFLIVNPDTDRVYKVLEAITENNKDDEFEYCDGKYYLHLSIGDFIYCFFNPNSKLLNLPKETKKLTSMVGELQVKFDSEYYNDNMSDEFQNQIITEINKLKEKKRKIDINYLTTKPFAEMYYCVDKNGFGWVFPEKPTREEECGIWVLLSPTVEKGVQIKFDYFKKAFPNISWKDEPVKVIVNVQQCK